MPRQDLPLLGTLRRVPAPNIYVKAPNEVGLIPCTWLTCSDPLLSFLPFRCSSLWKTVLSITSLNHE